MIPDPVTVTVHCTRLTLTEVSKAIVPWQQDTRAAVMAAVSCADGWPYDGPIRLRLEFWLSRPRSHYRTGRYADQLRLEAPAWPAGPPDLNELVQATSGALTGTTVVDGAQLVSVTVTKRYTERGTRSGCRIVVEPLAPFFPFDPAKNLA